MDIFPWIDNGEVARRCLDFLKKKIEKRDFVSHSSSLPYAKSKMRSAILKFAPEFIKSNNDPKKEQGLIMECYMSLANFMNDDEADMILATRSNNSFEKIEHERYLQLLSKKYDEERNLLDEIEQVYIDHGFLKDINALVEKFISNPENFLLFRGEKDINEKGFRFTTDKEWAKRFGDTLLEGRLPPNSKVHVLKYQDIQGAPQTSFTTKNSWFLQFIEENNYDAIISVDPMSPQTLEILVNPKHLENFKISNS